MSLNATKTAMPQKTVSTTDKKLAAPPVPAGSRPAAAQAAKATPTAAPARAARVRVGPFSLEATREWSISTLVIAGAAEASPDSVGLLSVKGSKPFQKNIVANLEQVGPNETCEGYLKKQTEMLKKANGGRVDASAPERVKLDSGQDGVFAEQTVTGLEGRRIRQLQFVTIKNGLAHHIIASHLDGKLFDKARPEFRKMLLSFA
jgi:hypothetical protein